MRTESAQSTAIDQLTPAQQSREWVLTNGLGGFAMGTAGGLGDRRYHSLLTVAQHPPVLRMNLVSRIDERLTIDPGGLNMSVHLTPINFVGSEPSDSLCTSFEKTPTSAAWIFTIDTPEGAVVVRKELQFADGIDAARLSYRIDSDLSCTLELRPLLAMRDFHTLNTPGTIFPGDLTTHASGSTLRIRRGELGLSIVSDGCERAMEPTVWHNITLGREQDRGLDFVEDLYCPCVLTLQHACTIELHSREPEHIVWATNRALKQERIDAMVDHATSGVVPDERVQRAIERLCAAADDFIVRRDHDGEHATSVLAGYPWFSDWGRDTMIALPGLMLVTGRFDEAIATLGTFAAAQHRGLIPNRFDDWMGEAHYNTVDASLWFVHACAEYVRVTGDQEGFDNHLRGACEGVVEFYQSGTDYAIAVDPSDGLVSAGNEHTQLTWMDAQRDGITFTPRHGKPIEINALWINALRSLAGLIGPTDPGRARGYHQAADLAERSLKSMMTGGSGGLVDCLTPTNNTRGVAWKRSTEIRPNQLFAVSLPMVGLDEHTQRTVLRACGPHLLTPVGVRTLAPIDPDYCEHYTGPMVQRDCAYHNGTVWPWLLGAMCEADLRVHSFDADSRARTIDRVCGLVEEMDRASIGSIAEIYDAEPGEDGHHAARGCPSQAWSIAEPLRVLVLAVRGG
ncbi:MAG: glycogen debranching enzyme family protein [Phycisphaerales bacterium]|nr:glycogen debranching enzyme family protein [Phycisphaerales bacterium]